MLSDRDRAAIEAHVETLGIDAWAPLTSAERDLVRRALAAGDAGPASLQTDTTSLRRPRRRRPAPPSEDGARSA